MKFFNDESFPPFTDKVEKVEDKHSAPISDNQADKQVSFDLW